jgi:transposase-like protein
MLKAIKQLFPRVIIQRCQFHVIKYCLAKLTRNPESIAGQILRLLVLDISKVKTKDDLDNWINDFKDWYFNYENFLNEKTYSKTRFTKTNHPRWHYTHKNLHACFSHLKNALPYLFQYINHPTIPNTTNQIEGGINSLLQEKLRNHRGLKLKKRIILTSYFLSSKQ